jgi:hypothetical protein
MTTPSRYGAVFWVSVAIGALMASYGVLLLLEGPVQQWPAANSVLESEQSAQLSTIRRFATILLLHDFVLLPLVFGFAALMVRVVPAQWRAPLRFAALVSVFVLLIAAWGLAAQAIEVQPGNTHVLPNHYPASVALLLAPVWIVALLWGVLAHRRSRFEV